MSTIFEPPCDVLSILYQRLDLALKSPRTTKIVTRFSSKFFRNASKSS